MHIDQVAMTRAHYTPGTLSRIRMVVLHATAGRYSGDYNWLRQGGSLQAPVSVHYYIDKQGKITQLVADKDIAWHAGRSTWVVDGETIPYHIGCNPISLGIELENLNTGRDPYPAAQYDACVWLAQDLVRRYSIPRAHIVRHLDIAPGRKTDPAGFAWGPFLDTVFHVPPIPAYLPYRVTADTAPVRTAPRDDAPTALLDGAAVVFASGNLIRLYPVEHDYGHHESGLGFVALSAVESLHVTPDLPLLGHFGVTPEQANAYLWQRHGRCGEYTAEETRYICRLYVERAVTLGIDPLIALAQLAHETDCLNSRWAARPHRNPAGLGVTGQPGAGLSFPSWRRSIEAHLGRLLAYALTDSQLNTEQDWAVSYALCRRPLPAPMRGNSATIGEMSDIWATDAEYAQKLCRVANTMMGGG